MELIEWEGEIETLERLRAKRSGLAHPWQGMTVWIPQPVAFALGLPALHSLHRIIRKRLGDDVPVTLDCGANAGLALAAAATDADWNICFSGPETVARKLGEILENAVSSGELKRRLVRQAPPLEAP